MNFESLRLPAGRTDEVWGRMDGALSPGGENSRRFSLSHRARRLAG